MSFSVFDRVFVISLKTARERRARMVAQMKTLKVANYALVDAVNGRELDVPRMIQRGELVLNTWTGKYLVPGEVGCLMSHIKVWQMIVESRLATALVLEDDAEFCTHADEVLSGYMHEIPSDWDIIHFDSHVPVGSGREMDVGRVRLSQHVWRGNNEGGGTTAYALRNERGIAQYLLGLAQPLKYAVDGYTNWPTGEWTHGRWNGYIVSPFLCTPRGGESVIWDSPRGTRLGNIVRKCWRKLHRQTTTK